MGRTACTVASVELYLYSTYEPYGLYRAEVPVQEWPLPILFLLYPTVGGHAVVQLVEALRYKPEGRGFDSQ
jgi:hypothetical protein